MCGCAAGGQACAASLRACVGGAYPASKRPLLASTAPTPPQPSECNYQDVYDKYAYPGTKCYGMVCWGFIYKPVARQ